MTKRETYKWAKKGPGIEPDESVCSEPSIVYQVAWDKVCVSCPFCEPNEEENADQVNMGSLQRIADAFEMMAIRYTDLIDERDRLQAQVDRANKCLQKLERQVSAYKGQLTRMKKAALPAVIFEGDSNG